MSVEPPQGPPPRGKWLNEVTAIAQVARLVRARRRLRRVPRGCGGIVIDIPGWKTAEWSMAPLRTFLRRRGHDARPWGFGVNRGRPLRDAARLVPVVEGLVQERGEPVALVGWSLGGVIAREVARSRPELVRQVVTFGTPAVGGPTYTVGAATYGPEVCRQVAERQALRDAEAPIQVPITAIWTRRDGVVDWRACFDSTSASVQHHEVHSTHAGMCLDPDVWSLVAEALDSRT